MCVPVLAEPSPRPPSHCCICRRRKLDLSPGEVRRDFPVSFVVRGEKPPRESALQRDGAGQRQGTQTSGTAAKAFGFPPTGVVVRLCELGRGPGPQAFPRGGYARTPITLRFPRMVQGAGGRVCWCACFSWLLVSWKFRSSEETLQQLSGQAGDTSAGVRCLVRAHLLQSEWVFHVAGSPAPLPWCRASKQESN